jgi:hypothetical protein
MVEITLNASCFVFALLRFAAIFVADIFIFYLIMYVDSRDRPRLFDQVGHQTTNESIRNRHFSLKMALADLPKL